MDRDDFDPEDPAFRELLVDACFGEDGLSSTKMLDVANRGESISLSE